jgi:hypothetical protein
MAVNNYRILFVTVALIGILLFASPTISLLIKPPLAEPFSELYILGPNHSLKDVPFDIKGNSSYKVYLGIVNHLGSSAYYTCYIKLRNFSQSLPNATIGTPSPLAALYEFKTFLEDGQTWEAPLFFKLNNLSFYNGVSQLESLIINGREFIVNKPAIWNAENSGYYYDLVIELWAYNASVNAFQYNNRFVHLYLNSTGNI